MRILVFGGNGQLGRSMIDQLSRSHEVAAPPRQEVDISDGARVRDVVASFRPGVIINCAAYNFVDLAEDEPVAALAGNAWGPRALARAAAGVGATFVHYGTDFVFDGEASSPYTETDRPRPRSSYAISKLCGEWFAAACPRHYVLRVESLFGGARGKSSVDHLLNAITGGGDARAFSDRVVSPSYVEDVTNATRQLLDGRAAYGLYHCVNTGATTWVDLAQELARLAGRPASAVVPVTMAEANLKAPRPKYAALSNEKLRRAGIVMPTWQDAVGRYVKLRIRN